MSKALLIMAHGSRSDTANDEFRALVETVAESAHGAGEEYVAVLPCFLELARPSLMDAISAVSVVFQQGKTRGQGHPGPGGRCPTTVSRSHH